MLRNVSPRCGDAVRLRAAARCSSANFVIDHAPNQFIDQVSSDSAMLAAPVNVRPTSVYIPSSFSLCSSLELCSELSSHLPALLWQTQGPASRSLPLRVSAVPSGWAPPTVGLEWARLLFLRLRRRSAARWPATSAGLPAHGGHRARSARAASVGTTTSATRGRKMNTLQQRHSFRRASTRRDDLCW